MITFSGDWFSGGTSRKTAVRVKVYESGAIEIYDKADGKRLFVSDVRSVKVSSRLGNTPRYVNFALGEQLETKDNDAVDQWLKLARPEKGFGLIHQLESHWRFVALSLALVVAVIWLTAKYAVPVISTTIAYALPAKTLDIASRETLALLDKQFFDDSGIEQTRQAELQAHFAPLIAEHDKERITVLFRASESFGANAFALPNGTVVFTDEMVALAEHDDELLAVLGHEIGHVVHRHSLRSIVQNSLYVFIIALMTGDLSGTTEVILGVPLIYSQLAYSRKHELEADRYARDWMSTNNIPLHRFSDLMKRVSAEMEIKAISSEEKTAEDKNEEEEKSWTRYLSTHPGLEERLRAFE